MFSISKMSEFDPSQHFFSKLFQSGSAFSKNSQHAIPNNAIPNMQFPTCSSQPAIFNLQFSTCNFNMQFATCNLQHAIYNMQFVTCNLHHAICNMQFANCNLQHTICNMKFETCTLQHAICNMTNCQHKHYLLEYFLKKISTHQKMLLTTAFMFYFAGILPSLKIKPIFWEKNYLVKLSIVCNSLKSPQFNRNFVTSTLKTNFEASCITFYGS